MDVNRAAFFLPVELHAFVINEAPWSSLEKQFCEQ